MAQQFETALTKHKRPHLARLLEAARTCKCGPLKRYLEVGGTPDAVVVLEQQRDNKSFRVPLLHSAVLHHHLCGEHRESIEMLLNAGARIDTVGYAPNGSDRSCVMWAAGIECIEPLRLLLQRGADPCWQSTDGLSALHLAALFGPVAKCELLLQASEGRALSLRVTETASTALSYAVEACDLAAVKLLLQHGADLREVELKMTTLLHTAAAQVAESNSGTPCCVPVMQYLLTMGLDVNAQQQSKMTPLNTAAQYGNAEAAQLLLDYGADPTIPDAGSYTPLHTAVADSAQNLPLLQCLLSCSRVDINAIASSTKTAETC
jgi:ankyrin repeat protein